MKKIAIINGKGGAGKTTTAVMICLALRNADHDASIDDRDPQKTASLWLSKFPEMLNPNSPIQIIDTAPRLDSSAVATTIKEADTIVIPCRPSPVDLWTTQDTVGLLNKLGCLHKAKLLFNQVRPGTLLSRDLSDTAERIGLKPLKMSLSLRESYQHAVLAGWKALDKTAKEEITQLTLSIFC